MKKVIDFISKTSSGMSMGLFATLIIGTIIKQLCSFGEGWQVGIDIATIITNLMGVGIALGVAISMKKDLSVLEMASLLVVGAITSSLNLLAYDNPIPTITVNGGSKNPLLIYAVIICTIYLAKLVLIKKTPIDILLIPFTYIIFGAVLGFGLLYPCYYIIFAIQKLVEVSMPLVPELMSIIISVVMGMVLTMPISSVAICVAINIGQTPLAAGAALIGCSAQMIGFAAMSFMAKNSIGKSIGVGIGTSMLYWPNIIKKPAIWLPTILASFILGPIGVCLLNTMGTSAGAGMGTCGLVGQISSMEVMGYTNYQTYVSIFVIQILGSIILTLLFDFLFKNVLHLYSNEDLKLD